MPKGWESRRPETTGGLDKGSHEARLPYSGQRPKKAAFEPKGDTVFKTSTGYVACAITEGAQAFLIDVVAAGAPLDTVFAECLSKDWEPLRFTSKCQRFELVLGIQKASDHWRLPTKTHAYYMRMKKMWHRLTKAII
jgi:hypothetical protein